MKELRNPEKVRIGDNTYVISTIPAFTAQKILMKAFGAIAEGSIASLPPEVILDLLSYSAAINKNGAEVQLNNEELVEMMVGSPMELIELETRMVEKNFSFLGDGRLNDALSRMTKSLTASKGSGTEGTPAT